VDTIKKRNKPKKQPDFQWWDKWLEVFSLCGVVRTACKATGVARSVVYDHRETYPEFRARFEQAYSESTESLEQIARDRAAKSSDVLLIFLLKARKPDMYKDHVQQTGSLTIEIHRVEDNQT